MRLHNGARLKQAHTEPFLLGALERSKQAVREECLAHSAAIVLDAQQHASAAGFGSHVHSTLGSYRLPCVQYQVRDYALYLLAIGGNSWQRLQVRIDSNVRHTSDAIERYADQLVQISIHSDELWPLPNGTQAR